MSEERITAANVADYVIYESVVGSRAYGLDVEGSDEDVRGIYIAPTSLFWLADYTPPETIELREGQDRVYWEFGKFIRMACACNPSILEVLYSDVIKQQSWVGISLRNNRSSFLSGKAKQTYGGYATSQFLRIRKDLDSGGEVNWKNAMHTIRLLMSGTAALKYREPLIRVDPGVRHLLLAIRNGEFSKADYVTAYKQWRAEYDTACADTELPDEPDYERINRLITDVREYALRNKVVRYLETDDGGEDGSDTAD